MPFSLSSGHKENTWGQWQQLVPRVRAGGAAPEKGSRSWRGWSTGLMRDLGCPVWKSPRGDLVSPWICLRKDCSQLLVCVICLLLLIIILSSPALCFPCATLAVPHSPEPAASLIDLGAFVFSFKIFYT